MVDFLRELNSVYIQLTDLEVKDVENLKIRQNVCIKKAVQSLHAAADKLDEAWSNAKITRASGTSVGILEDSSPLSEELQQ